MIYEHFNVSVDLRPYFKQYGSQTAFARDVGITLATLNTFMLNPPFALAAALAVQNDALREHLITDRPKLLRRGRVWRVPDRVVKLERQFRALASGIVFQIEGGGTQQLQGEAVPVVEPVRVPSPQEVLPVLEHLIGKVVRERDEATQLASQLEQRLTQAEQDLAAQRNRAVKAERELDEVLIKIPTSNERKLSKDTVDGAARLFPSLAKVLAELPKA